MHRYMTAILSLALLGCSDATDPAPNSEVSIGMSVGEALYRKGTELLDSDPEAAIGFLTQSLEVNPDAPPALYNRAVAYSRVGRDSEAIADMKRLEEIEPAIGSQLRAEFRLLAPAPYCSIGNGEIEAGNFEKAIEKYDSALAYDPLYGDAWVGKGIALTKMGKLDEALECYNRAAKVEPENFYAYINRAELHHVQKRFQPALADFSKAIEISPDEPSAYAGRALVYTDLERSDEATSDEAKAEQLKVNVELEPSE